MPCEMLQTKHQFHHELTFGTITKTEWKKPCLGTLELQKHLFFCDQTPICRHKLLGTGISSAAHWWQLCDIYNFKTMQIELSRYKTLTSSMFFWKCHKTFIKVQNIPKKTALSLTRGSEIFSLDQTLWRGREMSSVIIIRIQ